jgi:hypothetical protein
MRRYRNVNGTETPFKFADAELNRNLRKCGVKIVPNRKKKLAKRACRKRGGKTE